MLKILVPKNMPTVIKHLKEAGRTVSFVNGSHLGIIAQTNDEIDFMRSGDIPFYVSYSHDVGLCGSDWYKEKLSIRKRLVVLGGHLRGDPIGYPYGREFHSSSPSLDLVARDDDGISTAREIMPGAMVITEHPRLTREYLGINGLRVAQFEQVPEAPDDDANEFRRWCKEKGLVAMSVVHGGIDVAVARGAGYGIMINETGDTLRNSNLKVVDSLIPEIKTLLISDPDAFRDPIKGPEIESLHRDLDRAIVSIYGETEVAVRLFRERGL